MSGKPWTPERKARFSRQQKARWRDPKLRKAQAERMADPAKRAASSERMKRLNDRMREDKALKKKCVRGMKRVRRSAAYRAIRSLVMRKTMARPENREKARLHACKINRDPKVREKQWAGRRRKQLEASAPQAPLRPQITGDVDAIFLERLAAEASGGASA
jgi:hypothetical protein